MAAAGEAGREVAAKALAGLVKAAEECQEAETAAEEEL